MNYLEETMLVKRHFLHLLTRLNLQKEVTKSNREELYQLTGEIAYLYGHAFIDQYDARHLSTLASLKELMVAFTYSAFSLEDDHAPLTQETLSQIKELIKEISDIEDEDLEDVEEEILNLDDIRESCMRLLRHDNVKGYNEALKLLIQYGEQCNKERLDAAYGHGDDDSETDDYEYQLYEENKEAAQDLEYYYNKYNELVIEEDDYNKDTLLSILKNLE